MNYMTEDNLLDYDLQVMSMFSRTCGLNSGDWDSFNPNICYDMSDALIESGVVGWVSNTRNHSVTAKEFDRHRDGWVKSIQQHIKKRQNINVSYGMAANSIARYLCSPKVQACYADSPLMTVVTQPIERWRLKVLKDIFGVDLLWNFDLKNMGRRAYDALVLQIRRLTT